MIMIALTLLTWSFNLIFPIKTIEWSLNYTKFLFEHKMMIGVSIIASIGLWIMYINAFGFGATIMISIIGGLMGFLRGLTVQKEMADLMNKLDINI